MIEILAIRNYNRLKCTKMRQYLSVDTVLCAKSMKLQHIFDNLWHVFCLYLSVERSEDGEGTHKAIFHKNSGAILFR